MQLNIENMTDRGFLKSFEEFVEQVNLSKTNKTLMDFLNENGILSNSHIEKFKEFVEKKGILQQEGKNLLGIIDKMKESGNEVAVVSKEALDAVVSGKNANDVVDNMIKITSKVGEYTFSDVLKVKKLVEEFHQDMSVKAPLVSKELVQENVEELKI